MTTTYPAAKNPADTSTRIEQTALQLFRERGYAGASIREISGGAGIAIATMFWHFPTKASILDHLLHRIVDQQTEEINESLDGVEDPAQQLRLFVRAVVTAHCLRSDESFVAESELRSLDHDLQAPIREKRLVIQRQLRQIIADGTEAGDFTVADPATAAVAILTMCTSVASWYRPDRGLSPDALSESYSDYALSIARTPA